MAIPAHVSKRLRQNLGDGAGGDLVTWLEEMRAEHARFMTSVDALGKRVEALGRRMDEGFAKADDRFAKIDDRFGKLDERLAGIQVAIADSKAELMKWMLVFWVGAVGAIAALAGVLRY